MFSKLKNAPKSAVFQLTLWYSAIFILGTAILIALAYLFLSSSLRHEDREFVRSKLREVAVHYEHGGLEEMSRDIDSQKKEEGDDPFFVRLAGPDGKTLFMSLPKPWAGFDVARLERETPQPGQWISVPMKDDDDVLEITTTLLSKGRFLQTGKSSEDTDEALEHFLSLFSGMMVLVVAFGFGGGYFLASRVLRPVRQLVGAVRLIVDTGRMDSRVPTRRTNDELDELVALFNQMLERIESLISGMRDALDNVAHDLRTPMTRLRATLETALQEGPGSGNFRETFADCMEESESVLTMLKTLMDISEAETGTMKLALELVELGPLIADAVDLYRYVAEEKGVSLEFLPSEGLTVTADRGRIRQVAANLLDNAVKYTPAGGRVEVETVERNGRAVIIVRDTGPGIPEDELPHIWERLYRGDKSRSQPGLGLGLSLVKAVVKAHGGDVEASSAPGEGARFTISLPRI